MNENKSTKKSLLLLGIFLLIVIGILFSGNESYAANTTVAELQNKFPAGKFWNHYVGPDHYYEYDIIDKGSCNNPDGWTNEPCVVHTGGEAPLGYPDCNSFDGGQQCMGFANKLFYDYYGVLASQSPRIYDLNSIKPGDILRYRGNDTKGVEHSVWVLGVESDKLIVYECNFYKPCEITWGRWLYKSDIYDLKYIVSAPYAINDNQGDTEKPTISEIAINPTKVTDDTIQVKVKASDNVGVTRVSVRVWRSGKTSDSGTTKNATYNSSTGYWEVKFSASDLKATNDYLACIEGWAYDEKGNSSNSHAIYDFVFGNVAEGLGKFVTRIVPIANKNYCLGISGTNNDDNLVLKTKDQSDSSQLWEVEEISDGIYKIINVQSNRSIDVEGGYFVEYNGCKMQLWDYAASAQQQFLIENYNGGYRIVPTNTTALRAINIKDEIFKNNNPIDMYESLRINNLSQTWVFEKVADSVKLSNSSVTLTKGSTKQLTAIINPNTVANKKLSWSSSNTSVAKVSSSGLVTAVGTGTATITVRTTDGTDKKATCKITVNNTLPFIDVKKSDWFYNAVEYTYNRGIIKGATATEFRPNKNITRGDLVTILWRMEGEPVVTGVRNFPDVSTKAYYSKAIRWATKNKVVNGYQNGNFGPNDNITREQLATILWNYAKYKGKYIGGAVVTSKYTDWNKITGYARPAMIWAVDKGVITGKDNGTRIDPQGTATRAETAGMIYNYLTKIL